ncbi:DeoR/GlpR family DNA-binding transcription regulator [Lapillicoccus jejuensis]|uniref:DeoR family transcriptional regulator n=1 Tax=Lapillicoccus jejuensis TaxID=402171 RepID=A0A542DVA6_9MICO|nr:DeoR/GlpR family DNA-binding transcription regulator [Lapillicoccus jejuensis]TQJ07031.1 DeoR family transcriptional regulator [Lapillicoccus jejuensis]
MASLSEFDREQAILSELDANGRVEVSDLSHRFGVSTVTVRKDLEGLERRGMLRRIRGGALVAPRVDEGAFDVRHRIAADAKRAVARQAAALVRPGDVIAVDSSTTCYYLAEELLRVQPLTVITNGLRTSSLLLQQSEAAVIMPGGVLRRASESMVGFLSDVLTGRGRVDKGFFGLVGLSLERGLLDLTPEEAHAKAALAQTCRQVYALFDSSKIERFGTHSFATIDRVTRLISDDGVPKEVHREWTRAGVAWDLVTPQAEEPARPARWRG